MAESDDKKDAEKPTGAESKPADPDDEAQKKLREARARAVLAQVARPSGTRDRAVMPRVQMPDFGQTTASSVWPQRVAPTSTQPTPLKTVVPNRAAAPRTELPKSPAAPPSSRLGSPSPKSALTAGSQLEHIAPQLAGEPELSGAPSHQPLGVVRQAGFILGTIVNTARASLGTSIVLALGFSALATVAAMAALDWPLLWAAVSTASPGALAPLWPSAALIGVAAGVGLEAVRSMSGYMLRRHDWTLKKLRELMPHKDQLHRASKPSLRLYVSGLRTAAFTAYFSEMTFQLVALGLVVWSVEAATPDFHLFANPDAATPLASILFLGETALDNFGLKDALGISWTALEAAPGTPFSLGVWVFQVLLIGFLARELWSAWRIKPGDISEDLHAALHR